MWCLEKCIQASMTLKQHWQWFFLNNHALIWLKFYLSCLLQNSVQAQWIKALLLVSSSLGPSMAINIFHWCLVRSWTSVDTDRFLARLFTFLSRRPIVILELVEGTGLELSSRAVKYDRSYMQINDRKLVMWPETDAGSELPLASFGDSDNPPPPHPHLLSLVAQSMGLSYKNCSP